MPWIARLTVIRKTKGHELDPASEPGRHRRGEVVSLRAVLALPDTGTKLLHRTFAYIFVTAIPDNRTVEQLQERLMRPHAHTRAGRLELANVNNIFVPGPIVSVGGASATVVSVDGDDTLTITDWSGQKPDVGDAITQAVSAASGEFQSFEGTPLGRKRLRLPVNDFPAGHKQRLRDDNWTDVTFTAARNMWKRYNDDEVPPQRRGKGDRELTTADDNAADDTGTMEPPDEVMAR